MALSKGTSQLIAVVSLVLVVMLFGLYIHTKHDIVQIKNSLYSGASNYARQVIGGVGGQEVRGAGAEVRQGGKNESAGVVPNDVFTTRKVVIPPTTKPEVVARQEEAKKVEEKLPRILCWILTDPKMLQTRAIHVKETWARHCDICLFMSSEQNDTFPTIGLDVGPGRSHLAPKSKAAWTYVYKHHLNDADYFAKADDDTFLVIENLKRYLAKRNPEDPEFFGHRMYLTVEGKKILYNSGGPGQILSRKSLQLMVEKSFADKSYNCMKDGQGEDYKTAWCLTRAGAHTVDTRDAQGRMTFMIFQLGSHFKGSDPGWYPPRLVDPIPKNPKCCSEYPIGFHYVSGLDMRKLYYYMYEMKHAGSVVTSLTDDETFKFYEPDGHEKETYQGNIYT